MVTVLLHDRTLIRIGGDDRAAFLQGLITNDIQHCMPETPLYANLLSPQGKLLFDFLIYSWDDAFWLDVWTEQADSIIKRLSLYKLRSKVTIERQDELCVHAHFGEDSAAIENKLFQATDPRHPSLGMRIISDQETTSPSNTVLSAYDDHRISLGVPASWDVVADRSFPMELGMAQLHAISYTKGCYVGQEIVARSTYRGNLRKALHSVSANTPLPAADTPITQDGKEVGILRSHNSTGIQGLAIIRLEEAAKNHTPLLAEGVPLHAALPTWFALPPPPEKAS